MKKAFRLKLLELCKTKAKKSNPDTFKFYVVLAGDNKATGAVRATGCRQKLKAPLLQTKSTKNEAPPENKVSTGKFEYFRRKKNKIHFKHWQNNPMERTVPKCSKLRRTL